MANEKRLIDAEALRKKHCEDCNKDIQEMCKTDPVCASLMWIIDEPTIDAVPVVRCKDCKYYGGITFGRTCRMFSGINTRVEMAEDGFCSLGERREGEQ